MIETLRLTDDEIVALVARVGSSWHGPLPTVDLDSAEALVTAAQRGERSIFVAEDARSWSSGRRTSFTEIASALSPAFGVRPLTVTYPVVADDANLATGLVFSVFASGPDAVIFCVTRPSGVTEVSFVNAETGSRLLREVVYAPRAERADPQVAVLMITDPGDEGASAILVGADGVRGGDVGREGVRLSGPVRDDGVIESALAAVWAGR